MRDRLIELLKMIEYQYTEMHSIMTQNVVDFLLQRGVIVPPVKVGDTLYVIAEMSKQVVECTVIGFYAIEKRITIISDIGMICDKSIGKTVFTDREDAVKALRGGEDNV